MKYIFCLSGVLFVLSACHSDGASSLDGGHRDAAAADKGDRAGPNGDASIDQAAMTATAVCTNAIEVQCERRVVCEADSLSSCLSFASLCPDYYFSAGSTRTLAQVTSCLGALAARTCTDLALGVFPSCFVQGSRPTGAGCAYPSQCQSGVCGSSMTCGTCGTGGNPIGAACGLGNGCQSGTFCHAGICTDASTIKYASEGQSCDLGSTPVIGCVGNLICQPTSGSSSAGTCVAAPGAGHACATVGPSANVCASGTVCSDITGGTCQVQGACGPGAPCDSASYCKAVDGGVACVAKATVGQPCGDPKTTSLPPCLSPATCLAATGTCVLPGAGGATCNVTRPCAEPLVCVAGTCQPLGATSCPATVSDGGLD